MIEEEVTLTLTLSKPHTKPIVIGIRLGPEFRMVLKNDIMLGSIPLVNFNDAAKVLKKRQLTTTMIRNEAKRLGAQMADYLEDEGGWHGEKRREDAERYKVRIR